MSRLYDALRGASDFRGRGPRAAGEQVWDALNFDAPVADQSSDPTPPPTLPMIEIPDVDVISAIEPRSRQTGDGRLPAPTECETFAKLDRRARLIPHSLDPTLVEHNRRLRTKIIQE